MDQSPGPIFSPSPPLPVRENMSYMKPVCGAKKVNGTAALMELCLCIKIPNALSGVHNVPN